MKRDMLIMWIILVVVVTTLTACNVMSEDDADATPPKIEIKK